MCMDIIGQRVMEQPESGGDVVASTCWWLFGR